MLGDFTYSDPSPGKHLRIRLFKKPYEMGQNSKDSEHIVEGLRLAAAVGKGNTSVIL